MFRNDLGTKFFRISKTCNTLFRVSSLTKIIFNTTSPLPLMSEVVEFPMNSLSLSTFFEVVKQLLIAAHMSGGTSIDPPLPQVLTHQVQLKDHNAKVVYFSSLIQVSLLLLFRFSAFRRFVADSVIFETLSRELLLSPILEDLRFFCLSFDRTQSHWLS